jgi:peptidylprolyl isomerase
MVFETIPRKHRYQTPAIIMTMYNINADTARYCYIDLDLRNERSRLAYSAAFCYATDTRYGFASKHLLDLPRTDLVRLPELLANDHEWGGNNKNNDDILVRHPDHGSRIIVQLHWEDAPLACENFATLCHHGATITTTACTTGKKSVSTVIVPTPVGASGVPLTYRNSTVHRIQPGFVIQGGDFVFGNGSGGECIYHGKKSFKDEKQGLSRQHDRRGILSMGNSGKNSNTSQWFITLKNDKLPQCDGKHVVFGHVVSGWDVLTAAEQCGCATTGDVIDGPVMVTDCGLYVPLVTPAAGYWFDRPDPDSYHDVSPIFRVRPRVGIYAPPHHQTVAEKMVQRLSERRPHQRTTVVTVLLATPEDCQQALDDCAVDVIVYAPKAVPLVGLVLRGAWLVRQQQHLSIDQVVLATKPLEVDRAVYEQSWFAPNVNGWQLD